MEDIKISIIVPVYNDEDYIAFCMDSLINQTLKEIEIIAVNDASSDDSLRVLREYADNDERIRIISFEENRSAFQARKAGIEDSRGNYIMFADADDSLELDACEKLWKLEKENPVDILHFGTNVITECVDEEKINGYKKLINPCTEFLYCGEIFQSFVSRNFEGHLWNKIFKRELCIYALSKCQNRILPKGQDKYFYWVMAFYARTYRGYPDYVLYNYRYGLGIESAGGYMDISKFELFCKQAWTEEAIEIFMNANAKEGTYGEILKKSRRNLLRHCVKNWKLLEDKDKTAGLKLILEYWKKNGDIGELVGSFCDHYKDKQNELIETINHYQKENPMQPKEIHTIGTYYHIYNNGGIQRVISKLMSIWIKNGYRVLLFIDYEKENDYDLPEGVERVVCTKSGTGSARNYTERGRNLEQLIREYKIDVMVYHAYLGPSLLWDLLVCKFLNVPFVIYYHNVFTKYMLMGDERFYKIPDIARLSDGMVVLSDIDKKFWECFNPNVHLVKNPLTFELNQIEPASLDNKFIVWVGRLDEIHKRFQEPVTIMKEVLKKVPDAKLFIIGKDDSGKNYNRLQQRIMKLNLEDSIILCGYQEDVAPFYKNASVYLMTSTHEGSPMTLIESLSFGLPTVMYELPYLKLVNGNNGIISVKQEDVEGAAIEICKLLEDKEYRSWIGKAGRMYMEDMYATDDIAKEWNEIFGSFSNTNIWEKSNDTDILLFETLLMHFKILLERQTETNRGASAVIDNDKLKKKIAEQNKIIKQLENDRHCLEETRKSFSYRLGLFLTAIPRKMRQLLKE